MPTTPLAASREHHQAGRLVDAEAGYRQVLALDPANTKARALLAALLLQLSKWEDAIAELGTVLKDRPDDPAIHINLSAALLGAGRAEEAVAACRRALDLAPENHQAYFNLGHALLGRRDFAGAVDAYREHVRLNPSEGRGYGALGDALKESGQLDAAMGAFETAMTLEPSHPGAYLGIADLFLRRGLAHAALLVIDSIAAEARQNLELQRRAAELRLMMGQFEAGWDDFDRVRFASIGAQLPPEPPPHWSGEDLRGKRLLIWSEQGLGDEVLYASIIPELVARGIHCTLACSARMVPVFQRSLGATNVVERTTARPSSDFDVQVQAGSLGRYLRRAFGDFPRHAGYLCADPSRRTRLRDKYEALAQGRRIVGIAWKSKHIYAGSSKSADLANLGAILSVPNAVFVNLQYGDCARELASVRTNFGVDIVHDETVDQLSDAQEFFAQVAAMDLVITTSNSTAHVAGSMNIPTWLMLPSGRGAVWYWFLGREDSPWYPSLRLFRSTDIQSGRPWEERLSQRIAGELVRWTEQARAST